MVVGRSFIKPMQFTSLFYLQQYPFSSILKGNTITQMRQLLTLFWLEKVFTPGV